jgi:hypothetical protein
VQKTYAIGPKKPLLPVLKFSMAQGSFVTNAETDEDVSHQAFYKYVTFLILAQSVFFYASHYIWKMGEGGGITSLTKACLGRVPHEQERLEAAKTMAAYFLHSAAVGSNDGTAAFFMLCEILPLVNVSLQMYCLDAFLQGAFSGLGIDAILSALGPAHNSTLSLIFPR